MVDVYPFRALRPFLKGKRNHTSFICPPYDVISESERRALIKKSSRNVVRVELAEGHGDERFKNAAAIIDDWKERGYLQEDRLPAFYLLETTYRIEDPFSPRGVLKRYGVLAALRLEPPGKGAVRPHEKTLPKAKEDRLKLLRAVQTHVSPIFGLFFDKKHEWSGWVKKTTRKKPMVRGEENKHLTHALWKIDDQVLQKKFQHFLEGKELFIADGHHRYEVAWAYKEEELVKNPGMPLSSGANYVMAYICPFEEPGLLMLPTHRLVHSTKTLDEWQKHLGKFFTIQPVSHIHDLVRILTTSKTKDRAIGWLNYKGAYVLRCKKDISLSVCLPNRPEVLRSLDVVVLHDLVMEEASGKTYQKDKDLIYTRDLVEIITTVKRDHQWVGFMLGSSGVQSLATVAEAGQVMPPKTTYFYPKVPTGFTLMPVHQRIG